MLCHATRSFSRSGFRMTIRLVISCSKDFSLHGILCNRKQNALHPERSEGSCREVTILSVPDVLNPCHPEHSEGSCRGGYHCSRCTLFECPLHVIANSFACSQQAWPNKQQVTPLPPNLQVPPVSSHFFPKKWGNKGGLRVRRAGIKRSGSPPESASVPPSSVHGGRAGDGGLHLPNPHFSP